MKLLLLVLATALVAYVFWRRRHTGSTSRTGTRATPHSMTPAEALEVLGLESGAGRQEIIDAHRRLMLKVHPDRGGSTYLARQLNEAKAVLLRTRAQ